MFCDKPDGRASLALCSFKTAAEAPVPTNPDVHLKVGQDNTAVTHS